MKKILSIICVLSLFFTALSAKPKAKDAEVTNTEEFSVVEENTVEKTEETKDSEDKESAKKAKKEKKAKAPKPAKAPKQAKQPKEEKQKESTKSSKKKDVVLDSFELGNYWDAVRKTRRDGDLSINATLDSSWKTNGNYSLKCEFGLAEAEDSISGFLTSSLLEPDFSNAKSISFDINNPNDFDLNLSFVIISGKKWENKIKTEIVPCSSGRNKVSISILEEEKKEAEDGETSTENVTKTPEASAAETTEVAEPVNKYADVKQLILYVNGITPDSGCFYIDNVTLHY